MKKLLVLILCILLLAIPISASAEEVTEDITTETPEVESSTDIKETISGAFVKWIEPNMEEIGVVVTLIGYGIVLARKLKANNKTIGTLNNNTITISKENATLMLKAMDSIDRASLAVVGYEDRMSALLEAFKTTAEDKARLEQKLNEVENYLKIAAESNLEFSNELAELLGLANIPNYVKEEIGARHVAAKNKILEAEKAAEAALLPTNTEEVKEDVGEEKKD